MIAAWIGLSLFLLVVFVLCGCVMAELIRVSFFHGVPSLSSTRDVVAQLVSQRIFPSKGLILDLGCSRGKTLRRLSRAGIEGPLVGYEKEFVPWAVGAVINRIRRSPVRLIHADFSSAPIEQAKAIYLFLLPSMMRNVSDLLKRRAAPGAIVISAEFPLPDWTPTRVIEAHGITRRNAKVFVYERERG